MLHNGRFPVFLSGYTLGMATTVSSVTSAAEAVGGELAAHAVRAVESVPVVERVAGLLTDRFLGLTLADLLKQIDRSGLDLSQSRPEWLERLAGAVPPRGGGHPERNPIVGGLETLPAAKTAKTAVTNGVATVGGSTLLRRLALALGVVGVAMAVLLVVRRLRATGPEPAIVATEPYLVGTEAGRGEPAPAAPPPAS